MSSLRLRDDGGRYEPLVDELVQAHLDTIEMLDVWHDDPDWQSHALYLKSLVRHAKRFMAVRAADPRPRGADHRVG